MELKNKITGLRLIKIEKLFDDNVKLIFINPKTNERRVITFKGLLFETNTSALNKTVKRLEVRNVLGFKAIAQLRYKNLSIDNYKQLLIQMEDSNENYKTELICVFESFKNTKMRALR